MELAALLLALVLVSFGTLIAISPVVRNYTDRLRADRDHWRERAIAAEGTLGYSPLTDEPDEIEGVRLMRSDDPDLDVFLQQWKQTGDTK